MVSYTNDDKAWGSIPNMYHFGVYYCMSYLHTCDKVSCVYLYYYLHLVIIYFISVDIDVKSLKLLWGFKNE